MSITEGPAPYRAARDATFQGAGGRPGLLACVTGPSSRRGPAGRKHHAGGQQGENGETRHKTRQRCRPSGRLSGWFVRGDQDPLSDPSKRREDSEHSIFERSKDGGYRLRDNVLFHLYVSTTPCGDARLHSPYEITADRKAQPPPLPGPVPGHVC